MITINLSEKQAKEFLQLLYSGDFIDFLEKVNSDAYKVAIAVMKQLEHDLIPRSTELVMLASWRGGRINADRISAWNKNGDVQVNVHHDDLWPPEKIRESEESVTKFLWKGEYHD